MREGRRRAVDAQEGPLVDEIGEEAEDEHEEEEDGHQRREDEHNAREGVELAQRLCQCAFRAHEERGHIFEGRHRFEIEAASDFRSEGCDEGTNLRREGHQKHREADGGAHLHVPLWIEGKEAAAQEDTVRAESAREEREGAHATHVGVERVAGIIVRNRVKAPASVVFLRDEKVLAPRVRVLDAS